MEEQEVFVAVKRNAAPCPGVRVALVTKNETVYRITGEKGYARLKPGLFPVFGTLYVDGKEIQYYRNHLFTGHEFWLENLHED